MLENFPRRLVVFFILAATAPAFAAWPPNVIFETHQTCPPSSPFPSCYQTCQAAPFGGFWKCQSFSTYETLEGYTQTDDAFLRAVGYTNQLSLTFACKSSKTIPATFQMGAVTATIASSPTAQVQRIQAPITSNGWFWNVRVTPDASAIVDKDCSLIVTDNLTLPNLSGVKAYVDLILHNIDEKTAAVRDLDNASTLPAKWTVARNLEKTLQNSVTVKQLQLDGYRAEVKAIEAIDPSQRTPAQKDRYSFLTAPGQLIDSLSAEISNLTLLKSQITGAMPDSDACVGSGPQDPVYCLKKVTEAKDAIAKALDSDFQTAQRVQKFLSGELQRLEQRAKDARSELQAMLKKLTTATGAT